MKRKLFLSTSLLVLAGSALIAPSARAVSVSYSADDLFIGFRSTSASVTNDYVLDIGQASQFKNAAAGFTLSLGNVGADLTSIFGAGWATDPNIFWGVVGTSGNAASGGDVSNVLYASQPENPLGTRATPYTQKSASLQGTPRANISTFGINDYNGKTSTANSSVGISESATGANSWASYNPGGTSFSYFQGMEGNSANGISQTALDLSRMAPSTTGTPGTDLGTFTINSSNGNISFQTAAAVPEPSTYASLAIGTAVALLTVRRRKNLKA